MGTEITRTGSTGKRAKIIRAVGICIVALITLFHATPVLALTDPDTMSISSVRIAHNLYETGDVLMVCYYELDWTDEGNRPDTSADTNFLFRLMNSDESVMLGQSTPYPYAFSGYVAGCASMYWDAASAPTWGRTHVLRFEENPGVDSSPKVVKYNITASDYSSFDTQSENQAYVGDYIVNAARELENDWNAQGQLITDGNLLMAAGATYFTGTIPGLRILCPDIFPDKPIYPAASEEGWTQAQEEAYENQWEEGSWISDSVSGLGTLFGGADSHMLTAIICVGIFLGVLMLSYMKLESVKPGILLGVLPLIAGSMLGFFPLAMLGLVAFAAVLFLAYTFFLKRAG
jgi:hypothetical protein